MPKNKNKMNNNNMNKKTIFWWSSWTMALTWDEYWMLVSALINCKLHIAKQFKSWKNRNKSQDVDWERKFKSQTINVKFHLL